MLYLHNKYYYYDVSYIATHSSSIIGATTNKTGGKLKIDYKLKILCGISIVDMCSLLLAIL